MDLSLLKRKIDFTMIAMVVLLCAYGVIAVYSATRTGTVGGADSSLLLRKELITLFAGIIALVLVSVFDYNKWSRYSIPLYLLNIGILLVVLFKGSTHKGAQSWIDLFGTFQIQPSEFSKIILIITMASFLAGSKGYLDSIRDLLMALLHLSVPMLLVLAQPDLGTALCYLSILVGMMLVAGFPGRHFAILLVAGIIIGLAVMQFNVLEEYQVNRLMVFVNPDIDPHGAGYNLQQSKIAIGSGQLTGKGLLSGTQTRLQFLPERHTDFIFSVIGEETGFVGAVFLLLLFMFLIIRTLRTASFSKNMFGSLIAAGIASLWLFQILVNVGMTIGLMPITGIPLPFISYGNSSLMVHLIAVGALLNIYARSYV
jgi:rod shape determining protein RodA